MVLRKARPPGRGALALIPASWEEHAWASYWSTQGDGRYMEQNFFKSSAIAKEPAQRQIGRSAIQKESSIHNIQTHASRDTRASSKKPLCMHT